MHLLKSAFIFFFVSCLAPESGSEKKSSPRTNPYSPAAPVVYSADYYAQESIPYSLNGKDLFLDAPISWQGYTFSLVNAPVWASIDSATGEIFGTPLDNGVVSGIKILAEKLFSPSYEREFSIAVNGDPLRKHAWHLNNTAQAAFSMNGGVAGQDINVNPVFERGVTGKNVRVAVSDTGVEINHDDLYQNTLSGLHKNYTLEAPYYGTPVADNAHGTAVASILGAKGWNNEGSIGVAPDAKFAGFQFLSAPGETSILLNQASGDFDVFNYSYGDYYPYDQQSDSNYVAHVKSQTQNGRDGLGAFYVKSAGNEYADTCFPHNANAPWENESPYFIVTGAVDAYGEKSKYSNAGSNLWVSAPGGDYGYRYPAIIAADLPTCFKGFSKAASGLYNDFEYGHQLNPKCNYTSTMNGTSSATPIVSGVIALILEQNPNLSWRDVKHILASSAEKIDPNTNSWPYREHPSNYLSGCASYGLTGHVYELGWVTNAAGFSFNNYYGFGMVDADAAVKMAQDPATNTRGDWLPLPQLVETNPYFIDSVFDSGALTKAIPDADPAGVLDVISVAANPNIPVTNSFVVESVQVKASVTHPFSGEVGIELTSPSGTKSVLLNINNSFLNPQCDSNGGNCQVDQNLNIVLASHAFYGENAIGDWTLKVIDGMEEDTGSLTRWKINFLGHNP